MRSLQSAASYKILIVDDQQEIHDGFRNVFPVVTTDHEFDDLEASLFSDESTTLPQAPSRHVCFDLSHALQGLEAIAMVAEAVAADDPFEMAFIDMRMPPGLDGLETIQRLWEIDPLLQVVICTAFSDYSWSEVISRLGTTDNLLLLKKPFAQEEAFQQAIAMTIKRRATVENQLRLDELRHTNAQLQDEIYHRRIAETMLQHAATHDHLTKLPNRNFLKKSLSQLFARPTPLDGRCDALIFLDVDNFKVINDSLGHAIGDELLVGIGERLLTTLREFVGTDAAVTEHSDDRLKSLVARLGGDEFVVFLTDIESRECVQHFAEHLLSSLTGEHELSGHKVTVGTSLGIAFMGDRVTSADDLMRNADLAMYRAKFSGKRCVAIFDEQMHESVSIRLELESALMTAIDDGGLRLEYQPIFNVGDGTVAGLESLIRWQHPKRGLISPIDFIPLAEETGMIIPIGKWVLNEACSTIRQINASRADHEKIAISVNVSKRQIVDPHFVNDLAQILMEQGTPADQLNLEITESMIMESPEGIVERLHEIRALGVRLHMDDFGTGHSSLSCLHRFPIDVLKIDCSFVSTMQASDDYESIVKAIITLAHSLGTTVIAEGIETSQQLGQLQDLACDFGQGFLLSRPKPIQELQSLLSPVELKWVSSTLLPTQPLDPLLGSSIENSSALIVSG